MFIYKIVLNLFFLLCVVFLLKKFMGKFPVEKVPWPEKIKLI